MKHMEESIKPALPLHPNSNSTDLFNQDYIEVFITETCIKHKSFGLYIYKKNYTSLSLSIGLNDLKRLRASSFEFIGWKKGEKCMSLWYAHKKSK